MEQVLGAGKPGGAKAPAGRSSVREWSLNALAVAFSLLIIYAGAELYVSYAVDDGMQFDLEMWRYSRAIKRQSANPAIGHEHTPGSRAQLMGVDVAISSQGLRDRDFTPVPPAGRTRILMLGDSLTFGWGVPADRTYSKRLEQMLRQAGYDVEVLNTGVGNYNTEMEVAYFLERGSKFQPQYVVLNYFINDAEPTPRYESSFFARHSRAFVYFSSRVDAAMRQANVAQRSDWQGYYASLYKDADGMRRVGAAVERLAAHCKEHGIKLLVANYPELRNPRDYPFPYVNEAVERVAAANGLEYFNLLPAVRDMEPASLWVTRPDPHPSAAAHEAFANALFRIFETRLGASPRREHVNGNA
jgi:lysophospholipase L1-like esterase